MKSLEFQAWWHSLSSDEKATRREQSLKLHQSWMRARLKVLFGVKKLTVEETASSEDDTK